MHILAIESTGKISSVAILNLNQNKILGSINLNSGFTHSQTLLPIINNLIQNLNLELNQIKYIACSSGPGSFTGIKIGAATAKSLAHALNIKIISVPTLDAMQFNIYIPNKIIVPIFDARRGEIYGAIYKNLKRVSPYLNCHISQIISRALNLSQDFNQKPIFLGDGVEPNKNILSNNNLELVPDHLNHLNYQSAQSLLLCAKKMLSESNLNPDSESKFIFDYKTFLPFYLRKTQAEYEMLNSNKK